jgi:hemerythrin
MTTQWYSLRKVGFPEIDRQHLELDEILNDMLLCKPLRRLELLVRFLVVLREHFAFEEKFSVNGHPFVDEEHRRDHKRIEDLLITEVQPLKNYTRNGTRDVTMLLSEELMQHVATFDAR